MFVSSSYNTGIRHAEFPAQRKFVSAMRHAHSSAHKRPQSSKNRKYERHISETIKDRGFGISDLDSVALSAAQACYANLPLITPTNRPKLNAHKPPKTVIPTVLMLDRKSTVLMLE